MHMAPLMPLPFTVSCFSKTSVFSKSSFTSLKYAKKSWLCIHTTYM